MPSGRRSSKSASQSQSRAKESDRRIPEYNSPVPDVEDVLYPLQHINIPELWHPGSLHYELQMFVCSIIVLVLQYINIYNSMLWAPNQRHKYNMYFHQIDPFVIGLLVVMCSRRVIGKLFRVWPWQKRKKGLFRWSWEAAKTVFKLCVMLVAMVTLVLCGLEVFISYSLTHVAYLLYPLIVNLLLYIPIKIKQRTRTPTQIRQKVMQAFGADKFSPLQHVCIGLPEINREEVERMSQNFNQRIRDVVLFSFWIAYYSVVMPLNFAQNALLYNRPWALFFALNSWITFFVQYFSYQLSPKVLDYMHRCALHLGSWERLSLPQAKHYIESERNNDKDSKYIDWVEEAVWAYGSVVKCNGVFYRSTSYLTTAIPGNKTHQRFSMLFQGGTVLLTAIFAINIVLVLTQVIIMAIYARIWFQYISLTATVFMTLSSLLRTSRNWKVANSIYESEDNCYEDAIAEERKSR